MFHNIFSNTLHLFHFGCSYADIKSNRI